MMNVPYPEITGNDQEQLRQIKRYLFSLADTLNVGGSHETQQLQDTGQAGLTKKNAEKIAREQIAKTVTVQTVTLLGSGWTGTEAPYLQTVPIRELNNSSSVFLLPDRATLTALWHSGTALQIENNNSAAVAYAYGAKPEESITTQILVVQTKNGG